jgi:UDP-4-amino-4,6-dideoxy-N-acetyl-beta-L-altrosamine transaminase
MTATKHFLPYGRQSIEDDDVLAVAEALREDLLTGGPRVRVYEQAFADATGAALAVACNSGTAALHLAMIALDLGPGDCAIVPTLTFLATANVVRMTGAEVVFADVDPESGLITAETLIAAKHRATRGGNEPKVGLPVHLNGHVCDMQALAITVADAGMALVEDACHALGVSGIGATTYSRMACFSTHPVKAIATGEGGMVTTCDAALAARIRRLRNHGMEHESTSFQNRVLGFDGSSANPWYYEMHELGWNYRLPDILCALGLSQLAKLSRFTARRREIAKLYDHLLEPLHPFIRPVPQGDRPHGWHHYVVHVDFAALGIARGDFMRALRAKGIGTQVHYIPLHYQPYYRNRYGELTLPGADKYYSQCLSIPLFPAMKDADLERVVSVLTNVVRQVAA